MPHWPNSAPDYRWPAELHRPAMWGFRLLGALLFHLAHFAGLIVWIFRRNKPANLILRTDGIGDALLFEPALRSFSRAFPNHELHHWSPAWTIELFAHHSAITQHLPIPRGGKSGNLEYALSLPWRAAMGYRMGRRQYDVVLYPVEGAEPLGNWLVTSTRATERWIAEPDLHNQFNWQRYKTRNAVTRILPVGDSVQELSRYASLASTWGPTPLDTPRVPASSLSSAEAEQIVNDWRTTATRHGAARLVGVVPATSMPVKNYPLPHWATVIRQLWQTDHTLCVLMGGPGDRPALQQLSSMLADIPHLFPLNDVALSTFAATISLLDAFLTVDTAAAHLALAHHLKTISIVGGGHPQRFLPWPDSPHGITLNHPMPCQGCAWRCKLAQAECITTITPAQIVAAFRQLCPVQTSCNSAA